MTIASLLSDFGIQVARYVTVNGTIVFDGVARTLDGYVHPTLGPATRVENHTFHGGLETTDAVTADAWWDEASALQPHLDAMEFAFPHFRYLPASGEASPCWAGQIDTGRGAFVVGVALRRDRGLPSVRVLNGGKLGRNHRRSWRPAPHLYIGGNLCVADQTDWDPEVHTVATATAWAAHWLAAYTEWRMINRWPVEGVHAHGS